MIKRYLPPFVGRIMVCTILGAAACCDTAVLSAQTPTPAATPGGAYGARGYIVGQVIDRASGRPMQAVNIVVVGSSLRSQTDLDGRYRIPAPAGVYSVRALRLGSSSAQQDGVTVTTGVSVTVNFALSAAVVQLQAVAVTAAPEKASSEDALLAMQRTSSRVSDGISAEAIKRTPGANAGDAILRVTGVSIVDNKFAVVRGLSERYSNTLLNGVELPSPEPQKKIVPLDIFPSSLLESIVVSKTATPDKPGDFAGGSVEVSTKEFPNTTVADINISTGYNSVSTFRSISHPKLQGLDFVAFDNGRRRQPPDVPAAGSTSGAFEAFSESLRNVWTPKPTPITPNFGGTLNLGGRLGGDNAPFGYVLSGNYNRQTTATPNRFFQNVFEPSGTADNTAEIAQAISEVDVGGIANFALRLGSSGKIGWKNLYTRNAEELVSSASNFSPFNDNIGATERRTYQVRYITRSLLQSQLSGDHLFNRLLGSRFEWKATLATARRDEPENRTLQYQRSARDSVFRMLAGLAGAPGTRFWIRFLKDEVRTAQLDWSTPISRLLGDGSLVKVGVLARNRRRAFDGTVFATQLAGVNFTESWLTLPPERIFSPELLGPGALRLDRQSARTLPYEAEDNIRSAYAMLDVPVRPWLRVVGGVRREAWALNVYNLRKDTLPASQTRRNADLLPSANVTVRLSDRQNLRFAYYQTVARPDPREVTTDAYESVAGDCANIGDTTVQRTRIRNGDIRWERYPRAGEIISLSAFAKSFVDPILEFVGIASGDCFYRSSNTPTARLFGGELEVRRALTFLPGRLNRITASANVTLVSSAARVLIGADTSRTAKLQGQSDQLVNLNFQYVTPDAGFEMSVLGNYFSDRVFRYGVGLFNNGGVVLVPDVIEQGRFSLDAKIRKRLRRATLSVSARNLTDNEVRFTQQSDNGTLQAGYLRPGINFSIGVGYALR
jgi:Carboxypeptidase regulatory-like domain/TonB-dependent Receptor Plug Domain/Outer membrane protein beta-barrel family